MSQYPDCDWCAENDLEWRTTKQTKYIRSFVSKPWFRDGHCLVIPMRHISEVGELSGEEAVEIMAELGRLGRLLDKGYGTGIMQKYMPLQKENGVKMNHLHFHVFPREEEEEGLFPTPYPNEFKSFYQPDKDEVNELIKSLRIQL
jgi:diadenosine tetraphosphate (Ap4A) HIT family hydrolase